MATTTTPPAPHDGSHGNLIARAEPKVKAASLAALLTPLALYYVDRYVPGVGSLPTELTAVLGTVVTGALTFAAGYAARAVDRIDLFGAPLVAKAAAAVTRAGDATIGATATDELETWTRDIAGKVAAPVKTAVADAVYTVETAAAAGHDPVAAAKAEAPKLIDSLDAAVAAGRAEATQALAPAVAAVATNPTPPTSAADLETMLRRMIATIGTGDTPVADAAQAAAQTASAPTPVPAIPAPAGPPTAPMQAVATGTTPAAG